LYTNNLLDDFGHCILFEFFRLHIPVLFPLVDEGGEEAKDDENSLYDDDNLKVKILRSKMAEVLTLRFINCRLDYFDYQRNDVKFIFKSLQRVYLDTKEYLKRTYSYEIAGKIIHG
jgi:hypothetical protein